MNKPRVFSLLLNGWVLLLIFLTTAPGFFFTPVAEKAPSFTDKVVHFVLFFILSVLVVLKGKHQFYNRKKTAWFLILFLPLCLLLEGVQAVIPSRQFSIMDAVMNLFGYALGSLTYFLVDVKYKC